MIEVSNLSKSYGPYMAVKEISFTADTGQVVGFLGPNGAGKTTTIRMLSTYLPPSNGTASVAGFDICSEADSVRENIGYLPEVPPLYEEMTVLEYLAFVSKLKKIPRADVLESIDRVVEACGLKDVAKRLCQQISRGYRQRVGIAQAIIHNPKVVILDEPTTGLDPKQIVEIRELIRTLGEDRTVLLSTHILPEVTMVCDKAVIITEGRVVREQMLDQLEGESLEALFLKSVSAEATGEATL